MKKIKKIELASRSFEDNGMWQGKYGPAGIVEGKLEILRLKVNEIIERLNQSEEPTELKPVKPSNPPGTKEPFGP